MLYLRLIIQIERIEILEKTTKKIKDADKSF